VRVRLNTGMAAAVPVQKDFEPGLSGSGSRSSRSTISARQSRRSAITS